MGNNATDRAAVTNMTEENGWAMLVGSNTLRKVELKSDVLIPGYKILSLLVMQKSESGQPLHPQPATQLGTLERDKKSVLGPPVRFKEAWPVAASLVDIGLPSIEALAEILERSDDPKKVAIAETVMLKILGYRRRNSYLQARIDRTKDPQIVKRLKKCIVPERSSP